jgi:hypothetical protein
VGLNPFVPLNPTAPVLHPQPAAGAAGFPTPPEARTGGMPGHEADDQPEVPWGNPSGLADTGVCNVLWGSASYLSWHIKNSQLPPLVSTGSALDARPGALGQPGTVVVYGNGPVDNGTRSGGLFTLGYWFNRCHSLGVDVSFLTLETNRVAFAASSGGDPILARPFYDIRAGSEAAMVVSFPGIQNGSIATSLASGLWGAEANLRHEMFSNGWSSASVLAGFRYLQLDESLDVLQRVTSTPPTLALQPVLTQSLDSFRTRNSFFGGQFGFDGGLAWWRLTVDVVGKIALGSTQEVAVIKGNTAIRALTTGASASVASGVLALPSNIGHYSRDQFTVVPEVGVNVGFMLNQHVRATVGYSFLYMSEAWRPGDQIDRVLNTAQVPGPSGAVILAGPARPLFPSRDTDFWAQGVNVGVEFRY